MKSRYLLVMMVCVVISLLLFPALISAQETATPIPPGTPIEITGVVSQTGAGTLTVAGLTVDVSAVALDPTITIGTTISVTGNLLPGNVISAQIINVINPTATPSATAETTPETTPAVTPEVTPTVTPIANPNVVIVVEGPVINIVNNIITIYDFDIQVEPANPILNILTIGDIAHIEGAFNNSGVIVATVVSNLATVTNVATGATVGLDGPIEAINGNVVTVNGIPVQFAPDDPRLATLQVGNFLNVQGNFVNNGTVIVLVVVNVTIINNVVINNNPYCWYHDDGMGMAHWHCDGMGMGDAMGMGDPGMGMGDPGMGMGMGG